MGKKYICEVKRDWVNNELELVQHKLYETSPCGSDGEGKIKFKNGGEMQKYFKDHCISEDELRNDNMIFVVLFWLLLLILLGMLIFNLTKGNSGNNGTTPAVKFGRLRY